MGWWIAQRNDTSLLDASLVMAGWSQNVPGFDCTAGKTEVTSQVVNDRHMRGKFFCFLNIRTDVIVEGYFYYLFVGSPRNPLEPFSVDYVWFLMEFIWLITAVFYDFQWYEELDLIKQRLERVYSRARLERREGSLTYWCCLPGLNFEGPVRSAQLYIIMQLLGLIVELSCD